MDYSPYRHRSRYGRSSSSFPWQSIFFFVGSVIAGFLLFWGIKSLFFTGEGEMIPARFANGDASQGEIQLSSGGGWQSYQNETTVIEGDSVRSIRGNNVALQFTNNAILTLSNGAEVLLLKSRKKDDIFVAEILIQKGEVWLSNSDETSQIRLLSKANEESIVMQGKSGEFFVSPVFARVISGESGMQVKKLDENEKIRDEKTVGVGQEIALGNFSLQAYAREIEISPFFVARKGGTTEETSETPDEETKTEEKSTALVAAPSIVSPGKNGETVETSKIAIQISGTVDKGTAKVFVQHNEEEKYALSKFEQGQTEWSYFANIHAGNLKEGENIYKIFAEDENGKLSDASVMTITYTGTSSSSSNSGSLAVTSPNGGKDTSISTNVISLQGTAPANAAFIVVDNTTKDTSYTLKYFKKGDETWKYSSGEMDDGSYSLTVKALDAQKRVLGSDKILITVNTKKTTSTTPKSSAAVATPSSSPAPTHVVSSTTELSR